MNISNHAVVVIPHGLGKCFRSRNQLIVWFAENSIRIADAEIQKAGGWFAYLGLEEKDD